MIIFRPMLFSSVKMRLSASSDSANNRGGNTSSLSVNPFSLNPMAYKDILGPITAPFTLQSAILLDQCPNYIFIRPVSNSKTPLPRNNSSALKLYTTVSLSYSSLKGKRIPRELPLPWGFVFASNGHNRFSLLILYFDIGSSILDGQADNLTSIFMFQPFKSRLGTIQVLPAAFYLQSKFT